MKANVTYWLDKSADKFPDKPAFVDEHKTVTFSELRQRAMALATQMIRKGLFKRPVVVYLEKGVDVLVSFMGAAYSCNFYSPIDIDMPVSRVNKILEVLQPSLVVTSAALQDAFKSYNYEGDYLIFEEASALPADKQAIDATRGRGIDTDLMYCLLPVPQVCPKASPSTTVR